MSHRTLRLTILSASALLPFTAQSLFSAPVSVVSQTRSVTIGIPSDNTMLGTSINQTMTAPDNNPFTASLNQTLNLNTAGSTTNETGQAAASQNSSFGNSANVFSVSAAGTTSYGETNANENVTGQSSFEVQFQVFETRSFTLSGSGSFVDTSAGATDFSVMLTGPSGTIEKFDSEMNDPDKNDGSTVSLPFSFSGTLAPGTYTLDAESEVGGPSIPFPQVSSSYNVNFDATAPSIVSAVPLPSAASSSTLFLTMLAGLYWLRRNSRRWLKLDHHSYFPNPKSI